MNNPLYRVGGENMGYPIWGPTWGRLWGIYFILQTTALTLIFLKIISYTL